ncbi:electron transfer flavoprotein [Moorella sulfitireducens (nom. illeg.)]|uniref:electron transfer flavoprotein n=1 Tax=Neomoorella sulfitireducens TaxID=2972948 RepID=UPI0021ABD739|nr:electron transfer flavoprotein [Moorella sulfitireducens]
MNIIACYKIVPDEKDIQVRSDRSISIDKAEWVIGQYDLNAVEAAMQIYEAVGGKVTALSVGDRQLENSKLKKGVLSRGPQELFLVIDEALSGADTNLTARALAAAARKIGFDLIICGEGSQDLYSQQVGIQLGQILNVPTLNAVSRIVAENGKLIVERSLEDEVEVLEVSLPAVISVTTDINQPRIASMKDILAAGKKPVTQWSLADVGLNDANRRTEILYTLAPEQAERKRIILEGESEEVLDKFYELLRKAI